ncbi:hypothetical protein ACFL3D_00535 [Candidatus Omnitrophota bacterium]
MRKLCIGLIVCMLIPSPCYSLSDSTLASKVDTSGVDAMYRVDHETEAQGRLSTQTLKKLWDAKLASGDPKAIQYDPNDPAFIRYDPLWDRGTTKFIHAIAREKAVIGEFEYIPGPAEVVPTFTREDWWLKKREQDLISDMNINGRRYDVQTNYQPILNHSMMFVAHAKSIDDAINNRHRLDADRIHDFLTFQQNNNCVGYFNSFEAGASIKQFHIQMAPRDDFPGSLKEEKFEIEVCEYQTHSASEGVIIKRSLRDNPRTVVSFESDDKHALAQQAGDFAQRIQAENIPHNVVFVEGKVYFVLRRFEDSYEFKKRARALGGLEICCGVFTFYQEAELDEWHEDENVISEFLRYFALSHDVLDKLLEGDRNEDASSLTVLYKAA